MIDGQHVQIGNAPDPSRAQAPAPAQPSSAPLLTILQRVPISPALLAAVAVGMIVVGTTVNVVVGVLSDPFAALARGGVLAPLGVGVLGLALLKGFLGTRQSAALVSGLGDDGDARIAALRPLLQGQPEACTVAALAQSTGWSESTVVRVLALMRSRGEVVEELDLDSGQFYYTTLTLPPRDLNSRLGELHP